MQFGRGYPVVVLVSIWPCCWFLLAQALSDGDARTIVDLCVDQIEFCNVVVLNKVSLPLPVWLIGSLIPPPSIDSIPFVLAESGVGVREC